MKRFESIVLNVLFLLHCFLLMLLLFESKISIPYWLQPLGRMHPLMLHFPVAFIVLLVLLNMFKSQIDAVSFDKVNRFLLYLTSISTVLATLMGLFLSLEESASELMNLHKWIGVGISFAMYLLVLTYAYKKIYQVLLYGGFIAVLVGGHYGAGLTHGTNFLTEPIASKLEKSVAINESTPIFEGYIQPILDEKCISCHNPEKHKGGLDVSNYIAIEKGGENGALWVAKAPEASELILRSHLPIEDKNHMPPEGKPQLNKGEIRLLSAWIKQGASNTITLAKLPKKDTLAQLISARLNDEKIKNKKVYNFDFADKKDLKALESPYVTVLQKSPSSPAIDVVINGRETYKSEFLTSLSRIEEQIVSLNASYLPIDKSDIEFISTLYNLEELSLNFTDIKTDDLKSLIACSKLKTVSLSGTQVDAGINELLKKLPSLSKVYLWNTSINKEQIKVLKEQFSTIYFESGFVDDGEKLQLTPPLLLSKNTIITKDDYVELGHKMAGVEVRYTTDGSKPDKNSQLYEIPIQIDLEINKPIKTIAYKENWLPSKVKNYNFFDKGYTPEKLELEYAGNYSNFIGDAARILIDNNKASGGGKVSPYWATFKPNKPLVAIADFGINPPLMNEIRMSYALSYREKVEPISLAEVWGGQNKNEWTLLKRIKNNRPKKVDKKDKKRSRNLVVKVSNTSFRYYKIVVKPVKKATLYADQLFFF